MCAVGGMTRDGDVDTLEGEEKKATGIFKDVTSPSRANKKSGWDLLKERGAPTDCGKPKGTKL